ncbi:MAG: DUF4349 domain-containing protein [Terrimesophilobacter sp.]
MRRSLILVPLALSAALLTGCAVSPSYDLPSSGDSSYRGPEAQQSTTNGGSPDMSGPSSDVKTDVIGPQIITTVDLSVTVKKPLTAADDAAKIAERLGGTVSYRTENAAKDGAPGSARLTLRIPSAKVSQALDDLKKLGVALDTSISSIDVTTEVTDLDARITSLETSVDRLLALMSQATSTENLLAVESALSQRQAELESLKAQQRYLKDQVQLSTVNLSLVSEEDTPATEPDTFWTGLVSGWNGFVGFWAGVLVALGVLVPWLITAGLITLIVTVWVKRSRRRRAEARSAAAGSTPEATAPVEGPSAGTPAK